MKTFLKSLGLTFPVLSGSYSWKWSSAFKWKLNISGWFTSRNEHVEHARTFTGALHWYRWSHGLKSRKGEFFSRRYFHCCSGNVHYCEDCFIITSLSAVHMYNFHLFTVIYTSNVVKHDNRSNLNTSIDQYHYNKLLGHTPSANWMFEPSQLLCFFVLLDNNHSFPR